MKPLKYIRWIENTDKAVEKARKNGNGGKLVEMLKHKQEITLEFHQKIIRLGVMK